LVTVSFGLTLGRVVDTCLPFLSSNRTFRTFTIDEGTEVDARGGDNVDLRGDIDLSRLACFRLGGDGDLRRVGDGDSGVSSSSSSSDAVDSTNSFDLY